MIFIPYEYPPAIPYINHQALITPSMQPVTTTNIHTPNPLADYRFFAPLPDGRALVSCHAQNAVLVVDRTGDVTGTLSTVFALPEGIAINSEGTVFVVDRHHHCIHRYDADLVYQSTIVATSHPDTPKLNQPVGIAISAINDQIWVADNENHRVVVFDAEGRYLKTLGDGFGPLPGQLFCPCGIALYDHPAHGELVIVSEWGGGRVQVFKASTGDVFAIYGGVPHAHHVVVDSEGVIYVTEYSTRSVKRFSLDGDQSSAREESVVSLVAGVEKKGLRLLVERHRVIETGNEPAARKRKMESVGE